MIARYIPTPRKLRDQGLPVVRVTYIKDQLAYLVHEGPDQSEIRWKHNGRTVIVSNTDIERVSK